MARYFFHLRSSDGFTLDEEGLDLGDRASVVRTAIEGARDVMRGEIGEGRLALASTIEVDNEAGHPVLTVRFKDVIDLRF